MTRISYLLYFVILAALVDCGRLGGSSGQTSDPPKVLGASRNQKYGLSCLFYGERVDAEGEPVELMRYVAVRDDRTRKEVRYVPVDENSMPDQYGTSTKVWSVDEEYLILSRGRFEGFCIIKAADALEHVEKKTCTDFVR